MILFYQLATVVMVIAMAICYIKYKCINVICLLVLSNFISFFALYYSPFEGYEYALLEMIRLACFSVFCMVFAVRSVNPLPYLCYSLVIAGFIFANGLFIYNSAIIPDHAHIFLTCLELVLFISGVLAVSKAKTRNDIPDYTIINRDNTDGSRFIGGV